MGWKVRRLPLSIVFVGFGLSFSCRFSLFTGPSGPWKDSVGQAGHAVPPFTAPESRSGHRAGQLKGRASFLVLSGFNLCTGAQPS
eukprot:13058122-Alexandrium_andersonii.AAC.1